MAAYAAPALAGAMLTPIVPPGFRLAHACLVILGLAAVHAFGRLIRP